MEASASASATWSRFAARRRSSPRSTREGELDAPAVHARDAAVLRPAAHRAQGGHKLCDTIERHRHAPDARGRAPGRRRGATALRTAAARPSACSTGRSRGSGDATTVPNGRPGAAAAGRAGGADRRRPARRARRRDPAPDGELRYSLPGHRAVARRAGAACRSATSRSTSRTSAPATWASRPARGLPRRPVQPLPEPEHAACCRAACGSATVCRWGFVTRHRSRTDPDRAHRPAAGRAGPRQVEGRDHGDARHGPAQPRAGLRGGDGPVLRPDGPGRRPRRPLHRRAHRPDAAR